MEEIEKIYLISINGFSTIWTSQSLLESCGILTQLMEFSRNKRILPYMIHPLAYEF
jgi:hypothetical protein